MLNQHIRSNHTATAGNVEVESAAVEPSGLGCGCGYPEYVSPGIVERSDRIVSALRSAALDADDSEELLAWLRGLPRAAVAEVGAQRRRVGIVHGDVDSLAGWQLGVEAMEPADIALRAWLGCDGVGGGGGDGGRCGGGGGGDGAAEGAANSKLLPTTPAAKIAAWCAEADVSGLLCTHTCLPFGQMLKRQQDDNQLAVFNNGSAGMPNFASTAYGLMTRVSDELTPPGDSLYGGVAGGLRYDAVPVAYDSEAFLRRFTAAWPEGSDAHVSYHERIVHGPSGFTPRNAAREGVELLPAAMQLHREMSRRYAEKEEEGAA